ncbi:hypothetical protein NC651_038654 [Populus alba x Populus x berolinensis]|nr:hypothetical protein NC651_038654 [Populus alba x Populus x berolinensis]
MAVDMTAGTDVAYEVDVADETWRLGSDVAVVMACLVRDDMAVVDGVIDDTGMVVDRGNTIATFMNHQPTFPAY